MLIQDTVISHPLHQTLSRAVAIDEDYYADTGALEAGWIPAIDLVDADKPVLEAMLAHQAARHPSTDSRTRGSYLVGEFGYHIPAIAITTYLAENRVPDLSLGNLALRLGKYTWHEGEASGEAERLEVRFLSGRFAALPDDPAANHPDAVIVPDTDALREWLRASLETQLTLLIERIHSLTRLGRQAQWCLVADACAVLFLHQGRALKDEARGQAEGLAFVKAAGSPMSSSQTGYFTLQYHEHMDTFRRRGGCCRYYTVAEEARKCGSCVLRPFEEREQLLRDYMSKKYAGGIAP